MRDSFRTLGRELRFEPEPIKSSRFIASARPVTSASEAEAFVRSVAAEFPDARHTCFAYRLGLAGEVIRSSDDGEPGGSAGRPILAQIEGHDLTNVTVCVTRYFGGTKLGVGGLMRAYGGATAAVLDRATIETVLITRRVLIEHPYECSSAIQRLLATEALAPASSDFGERVQVEIDVPVRDVERFVELVTNRTAGLATVHVTDDG